MSDQKHNAATALPQAHPAVVRPIKKNITLASGVDVAIHKGKGKDLRDAGRIADISKEGALGYQMALMSLLCTFDGRLVTYEDVLEMDLDDIQMVMGAMSGKDPTAVTASSLPRVTSPN